MKWKAFPLFSFFLCLIGRWDKAWLWARGGKTSSSFVRGWSQPSWKAKWKAFLSRELFGRRCIFSKWVQPLSTLFSPSNTRHHPFHFLAFRYRKHNWIKLPFKTWTLMPIGVAFDGEQTYFPLSFDFARWIKRYEVVTSPFSVITLTPPRGES